MLVLALSLVLFLGLFVNAYIPALPTNSTQDAIAGGLNVTDISNLYLQWYPNGSYSEHVSYQLAGNGGTGISKGVLVHFSEEKASNLTPPTNTPWIALVSCDHNASVASMDEDIFTLARDKGAVSALLYSLHSLACVINPQYSDPQSFDQVFDIFSTKSLTSAHIIDDHFGRLNPQNKSLLGYDSQQLNDSASDVFQSLNMSYPVSQGYLLAVLQAYNATDNGRNDSNSGGATASSNGGTSGSPNTALAMIVLYSITGCVSALFCIVIISGAIRAIRHPERYGPRARVGDNGAPQGRARGLTRAILDTFPIVKFGTQPTTSADSPYKDPEGQIPTSGLELKSIQSTDEGIPRELPVITSAMARPQDGPDATSIYPTDTLPKSGIIETVKASKSPSPGTNDLLPDGQSHDVGEGPSCDTTPKASNRDHHDDVVPASIGREICPICIVDFEEGDDIRLLPCEGKHSFHQQCVDPWLLKLSSSCPICRHDFLALENMLSGHTDAEAGADELPRTRVSGGRFSQYLRFATGRQSRRRGDENDPTDPYMPIAPETSMYSGI